MCCHCWRKCQPEEAWQDEEGQKWDVCDICGNGGDGNPDLGKDLEQYYRDLDPNDPELPENQ